MNCASGGSGGGSRAHEHIPETPQDDAELAAYYQQLEDGEAEGYRAPMRTNYTERLIDTPQVRLVLLQRACRHLPWLLPTFPGLGQCCSKVVSTYCTSFLQLSHVSSR